MRVIVICDGTATAEDVDLDRAQAAARFGAGVAALIFDNQHPGVPDLTYRTAALRYGASAAALIFPSGAGTQAPAVNDNDGRPAPSPPLGLPGAS